MCSLSEAIEERDLGILVTDQLSVSSQCAEAEKKAMRVLGMIKGSSATWTNVSSYCTRILADHIRNLQYKPGHPTSNVTSNVWRKCSGELLNWSTD